MKDNLKSILLVLIAAGIGFLIHTPEKINIIKKEYITVRDTITVVDTIPKIIVKKIQAKQIDIDSLFDVAKEEAAKLFKDTSKTELKVYEAILDTTVTDSLSKIHIVSIASSRLPFDPKLQMQLSIEKELKIPTIYYEKEIPFWKEKSFIPGVAGVIILGTILILR